MKEELIKELVANSKFTNRINLQYQQRIELLQKEKTQLNDEINDLKSQLLHLRQMSPNGSGKETSRVEL
jgi:ribosomal protein L29